MGERLTLAASGPELFVGIGFWTAVFAVALVICGLKLKGTAGAADLDRGLGRGLIRVGAVLQF